MKHIERLSPGNVVPMSTSGPSRGRRVKAGELEAFRKKMREARERDRASNGTAKSSG